MEIENIEDKLCYYFSNALHARLKSTIYAHIWCRIDGDELYVDITPRFEHSLTHDPIRVSYRQSNMQTLIAKGMTVDDVAKSIEHKYRRVINELFFKKGGNKDNVDYEFIKRCEQSIEEFHQG